ncbi:MAG: glycerol kinase, partial [Phycisphaerales bacterium]
MTSQYILAIDQGTSGTKTVIFSSAGKIVAKASEPLKSYFPQPGFVEQDPLEIHQNVLNSLSKCLDEFTRTRVGDLADITCCGISNQRETFILWDDSGKPLCNAVVWQCKRSVDICNRLKNSQLEGDVISRTGLIIDPYFSGTKLIWLCENDARVRDVVNEGRAYFGTIDTWLLFKLTGGRNHLTDYTNASRTLMFNIHDLKWDRYILERFNLKNLNLPRPQPSGYIYGITDFEGLLPNK